MPRRDGTHERHATLYAREDLPRPALKRREAVVRQLADVAASGSIGGFDVVHWDKRVPVRGEAGRERTLLLTFRQWADDAGVSLSPGIATRRCYSWESGACREELVVPVLCLAVYEGERLVELAPHSTVDGVVTVVDVLEELRLDGEEGERVGDDGERDDDSERDRGNGDERAGDERNDRREERPMTTAD